MSVIVTEYVVVVLVVVGLPEIKPVDVLKDNPVGKLKFNEYLYVSDPPVALTGLYKVAFTSRIKVLDGVSVLITNGFVLMVNKKVPVFDCSA